jgi:hypothetical protein
MACSSRQAPKPGLLGTLQTIAYVLKTVALQIHRRPAVLVAPNRQVGAAWATLGNTGVVDIEVNDNN